jgi:hypothetical protein
MATNETLIVTEGAFGTASRAASGEAPPKGQKKARVGSD